MGVERILKSMNIPLDAPEGSPHKVFQDFRKTVEMWLHKKYDNKYFLEIIAEGHVSKGSVDGRIPLTIMITRDLKFYPVRPFCKFFVFG